MRVYVLGVPEYDFSLFDHYCNLNRHNRILVLTMTAVIAAANIYCRPAKTKKAVNA